MINKVIISGANGFIGNALLKSFVNNKVKVYALTNDLTKVDKKILRNEYIDWMEINVDFIKDIESIIRDTDIDVFYHFAWEGSSGSIRGNYNVQINNIYNACDAATIAAKLGCKKFVFAESIMEYEIKKAIDLTTNVSINTLYSTAKLAAKYMSKIVCQKEGIDYVGALISNVYGPGEKSERLINTTIRSLNAKKHCSFSSGEQLYDFIYIDDAVEILKLIGDKGERNESYYIGNIKQKKLKDYIIELCDTIAEDSSYKNLLGFGEFPNPTTILNFDEFDTKKVYNQFGYEPKVSFREGIQRTNQNMKGTE